MDDNADVTSIEASKLPEQLAQQPHPSGAVKAQLKRIGSGTYYRFRDPGRILLPAEIADTYPDVAERPRQLASKLVMSWAAPDEYEYGSALAACCTPGLKC